MIPSHAETHSNTGYIDMHILVTSYHRVHTLIWKLIGPEELFHIVNSISHNMPVRQQSCKCNLIWQGINCCHLFIVCSESHWRLINRSSSLFHSDSCVDILISYFCYYRLHRLPFSWFVLIDDKLEQCTVCGTVITNIF